MMKPSNARANFAARLAALLAERGWTRYRLAKESGLDESYVRRLVSGEQTDPGWASVVRLAAALGVSTEAFLHHTPEQEERGRPTP